MYILEKRGINRSNKIMKIENRIKLLIKKVLYIMSKIKKIVIYIVVEFVILREF